MKKITFLFTLIGAALFLNAQNQMQEKPYIEIVGTSEISIVPNQIFIGISLSENTDKSSKSIEQQEQNLIAELKKSGINTDKLVVSDASAYYGKSGWISKDVVKSKNYELEVSSATEAGKTFEALSKLDIKNANITRTDHTQMEEYKKQGRIEAIQAAKTKANYLLQAIGEELGMPLVINEQENGYRPQLMRASNVMMDYKGAYENGNEMVDDFKKIVIRTSIYTKWQIGK
jgi:uncharacterized protein YggE